MTEPPVWDRVVGVLRETFDDPVLEVAPDTTADDVDGWDSLTNVELIVALESRFGVRFHTGEIARLRNVGELVATIEKRLEQ